jgi:integrase
MTAIRELNPTTAEPHEAGKIYLKPGLISVDHPSESEVLYTAPERAADPIKSLADVQRMCDFFSQRGEWRNHLLWVLGINFGLRVSDLLRLRFADVLNPDCSFRDQVVILEQKTASTRKRARNRHIAINSAAVEAITLFLSHTPGVKMSDYLFRSQSNRSTANVPLHRNSADRVLKYAAAALGLTERVSTHTLRKTFAYHQMNAARHDPRQLLLLQKMFGHSSVAQTLDYIGITREEMEAAYLSLNLGAPARRPSASGPKLTLVG